MRKAIRILVIAGGIAVIASGGFIYAHDDLRWRAEVVVDHLTGQIDDVSFGELIQMLRPGSGFWLKGMVETHNPYREIVNPFHTAEDLRLGQAGFEENCVTCHGSGATGGSAPALMDPLGLRVSNSDWGMYRAIAYGIEGTAMPALQDVSSREIWQIIGYIQHLQRNEDRLDASKDPAPVVEPVLNSRLLDPGSPTEDWLTYSGSYASHRFSHLDQITPENGHLLQIKWVRQFSGVERIVEGSPIVNGNIMYMTEPPNIVHAMDVMTGEEIWTYRHPLPLDLRLCCGAVNRGVAIKDGKVFMGTLNAQLVALDSATGELLWSATLENYANGYSVTGAPLVVGDLVIIGPGGGDLGIRGFVDAYNIDTGELEWRTYVIPGEGEPGNETWSGDSWERGGGGTWITGSYDPDLDLIYWPVGNPGPNYQGEQRLGDNLYTNSILALEPSTGSIRWHFQFTPHDEHDWAANQIPMLIDAEIDGRERKLLVTANRNAFYYVLDRETGEFLTAQPYANQNWATHLDENGRPVLNEETILNSVGVVTYPGPNGATNWQSPSYSPTENLVYVPVLEWGQLVFKSPQPVEYVPGALYLGGGHRPIPGDEQLQTFVRALDPISGDLVWEHAYEERRSWFKMAGYVSTAGGVLFGGDNETAMLFDATTGEVLRSIPVGGRINASAVAYATPDGEQRFAIAAGRSLVVFGLP